MLAMLCIIVLIAVFISVVLIGVQNDDITASLEDNSLIPLLMFISDDKNLILVQLVFIDSATKNMAVYDVPRRLGTIIPRLGRVDRIDNLYRELGASETRDILQNIFDTRIDFFLDMDISDVETIVDLIEGITVFLPTAIDGGEGGNSVLIPGGNVRLDGEKTVDFVVYESSDETELEWIGRRWNFVRELFRSMREYPLNQPDNLNRFFRHIRANFKKNALRALLVILNDLKLDDILTQRILGNEREVETSQGTEIILFPHFEGKLLRDSIAQISRNFGYLEEGYILALSKRLEILNGTRANGLAARTRSLYENFGFEVIRIGNAETDDYEKTVIVNRSGTVADARKVGSLIQAENITTEQPLEKYPEIDITIILGSDFNGWHVQSSEGE